MSKGKKIVKKSFEYLKKKRKDYKFVSIASVIGVGVIGGTIIGLVAGITTNSSIKFIPVTEIQKTILKKNLERVNENNAIDYYKRVWSINENGNLDSTLPQNEITAFNVLTEEKRREKIYNIVSSWDQSTYQMYWVNTFSKNLDTIAEKGEYLSLSSIDPYVTQIGIDAFRSLIRDTNTITIPSFITTIDVGAFKNNTVESVMLSELLYNSLVAKNIISSIFDPRVSAFWDSSTNNRLNNSIMNDTRKALVNTSLSTLDKGGHIEFLRAIEPSLRTSTNDVALTAKSLSELKVDIMQHFINTADSISKFETLLDVGTNAPNRANEGEYSTLADIPSTGSNVVAVIGRGAFKGALGSKSEVTIPDHITDILEGSFFNNEITKVTLKQSLYETIQNKLDSIFDAREVVWYIDSDNPNHSFNDYLTTAEKTNLETRLSGYTDNELKTFYKAVDSTKTDANTNSLNTDALKTGITNYLRKTIMNTMELNNAVSSGHTAVVGYRVDTKIQNRTGLQTSTLAGTLTNPENTNRSIRDLINVYITANLSNEEFDYLRDNKENYTFALGAADARSPLSVSRYELMGNWDGDNVNALRFSNASSSGDDNLKSGTTYGIFLTWNWESGTYIFTSDRSNLLTHSNNPNETHIAAISYFTITKN